MRGAGLDFEAFYQREFDDVFRACILMTGSRDVAMDATQEAFTRAFVQWGRLRRHPWAGGWVMTTALNVCRRRARDPLRVSETPERVANSIESPKGDRIDLERALRSLPARQRQAAILHYLGDLPIASVAELMQISEGAVKAHLFAARKSLREALQVSDV
jgi:RNA polymerase sigma-70 factor (ECF subfamily)